MMNMPQSAKLYAYTVLAISSETHQIGLTMETLFANNDSHARKLAGSICDDKFPRSEGWHSHNAFVLPLPSGTK